MRLSTYILECETELEEIVSRLSYQMFSTKKPLSAIIIEAAGNIEVVRTNILDLLNRLDDDILMKEVGDPDGKIHQRIQEDEEV